MKNKITLLLILSVVWVSACQNSTVVENTPAPAEPATDSARTLTICLGYEPDSLYPYAASTQADRDVLQAIYDGPIDDIDGQAVPVILSSLPDYQDDSARLTPVKVEAGDSVVNINGDIIKLKAGAEIHPSGCHSTDCTIVWDGTTVLLMDQPSAKYELLSGITWSDGAALTAADSVYSFVLASDIDTPSNKSFIIQTASYIALDETMIEWSGLPGLVTDNFENYFWMPLPTHAWDAYTPAELLASEEITRSPLGWGPYVMDEWVEGNYIRLKKNPRYFRADEGLPKFDYLVFKITDPYGDTNMANLKFDRAPYAQFDFDIGEYEDENSQNGCDLTSSTADMSAQLNVLNILMNYFSDSVVKVSDGLGKQAAWLLFNQRSTADGPSPLFSNPEMRQAVAACIERGELADNIFFNLVNVPSKISLTYQESDSNPNTMLAPDPTKSQALLTQNGWMEGNPRSAQSIAGYVDGAPLSINYLVRDDIINLATANQIKESLTECGIQVNLIAVSSEVFWDRTAAKSIFQGNYHLAQISWPLPLKNPCALFASDNIPSADNKFNGLNFNGFSNTRVDEICVELNNMQLSIDRQELLDEIEEIINDELALVPLVTSADLMVTRSDFCTVDTGSSGQSELALIESFDYGETCGP